MTQKTISVETTISGPGLHSGKNVDLKFIPAGINQGIVFKRVDLPGAPTIDVNSCKFGESQRRTALSANGAEVHTVEHLMAALWALSVTNILIEISGDELPGMDGSAKDFYEVLQKAGAVEQQAVSREIVITKPIWCENTAAFVGVFPSDKFKISYVLDVPHPAIGKQFFSSIVDAECFEREIASARTFCLKDEALALQKMGFGKGANTQNTLVMDTGGPLESTLRWSDEPVRHKVLDLIGDMYLTQARIKGRIIALRSGHDLNAELVKKIKAEYQ